MEEQIYTIPVTDAFNKSRDDASCGCPVCTLYEMLQKNEVELIMGASMMEPDIRIKTNAQGFCREHFDMMLAKQNKLGLGLILESHLDEVRKSVDSAGLLSAIKGKGVAAGEELSQLEKSCYVCGKIEYHLSRMLLCIVFLWQTEPDFRKLYAVQPFFCLPHYRRIIEVARGKLPKKTYSEFYTVSKGTELKYMDSLREDVSWLCKKFDYRFVNEPWGGAKDADERAISFLKGRNHS